MRWREPDCESNGATDVTTGLDRCSYPNSSPSSDRYFSHSSHRWFSSYIWFNIRADSRTYFLPHVGADGP